VAYKSKQTINLELMLIVQINRSLTNKISW